MLSVRRFAKRSSQLVRQSDELHPLKNAIGATPRQAL
ncbi:hypothetical protein FHS57_004125 [Runella defluvii]|uniref:Uncharacterized protein n=1 Tax=Runella defluvii TaxID=370973 RepID=A0A7W5ZMF8_9BACT|nr:hypothetical protein [Runella defluvii]